MTPAEIKLIETIHNRPVVIWGARMTGIGCLRFAKHHKMDVLCFVDSDKAFQGKEIDHISIKSPDVIAEMKEKHGDVSIIIAVSIKEDEIARILISKGFSENDFIRYSDYCDCFFTIDVAGSCNLKCPSCALSMDELKKPPGFMKVDDFKQVIAKMKREVGLVTHISLYSWGEPFLHPNLHEIIDHAHDEGIATAVSSNLSIRSSTQVEKIIKTAPDYLKISLSGYYPEVYNTTHTGGDINLVKSNLYRIRHLMDKYGVSIFVEVNYHLYNNNAGKDLEKMQELCDELGFTLATVYANITPIERLSNYVEGKVDAETEAMSKLLLVDIDTGLEITKDQRHLPCRFLSNQININWDRSVPICCVCFDSDNSIIAQDFLKDSYQSIEDKKKDYPLCEKCTAYGFPPYLLGVNQHKWKEVADKNLTKLGIK